MRSSSLRRPLAWRSCFLAAMASSGEATTGPDAALDPAALSAALDAELFGGGSVDLSAALSAGRPVALVFWQAW